MARIVGVHGIGQQFKGAETLRTTWLPAMRDGLSLAGANMVDADELVCAFYGDIFRPGGRKGLWEPAYTPADIEEGFERELLAAWWQSAATSDSQVPAGDRRVQIFRRGSQLRVRIDLGLLPWRPCCHTYRRRPPHATHP